LISLSLGVRATGRRSLTEADAPSAGARRPLPFRSLAIADAGAAYADTPAGGMVFEDTETVRSLTIRFDTIRGEARPATELAAILSEAAIRHERLAQEQLQQ
jgi:hypothetical protein